MSDALQGDDGEQPEAPPKPPVVDGITAQDFALWRHQPVTKMFLKYLNDRQADFTAGVMERWLGGEIELSTAHEARGFAKCLGEVVGTRLTDVDLFYKQLQMLNNEGAQDGDDEAEEDSGQGAPAS